VQWAVDGDNVTLRQHFLEVLNSAATNLFLNLWLQRLIIEIEEFFAIKRLQTSQNALANAADSYGTDNLVFEIILILGHGGNVPVSSLDLFVCRNKVSDEQEDSHDNVFGDGYDVGTSNLGDGDTAIGLVCSVQIDMIGSNTSGHGNLELLCFGKTFGSEVTGVESEA
jgi:hypothetical protein